MLASRDATLERACDPPCDPASERAIPMRRSSERAIPHAMLERACDPPCHARASVRSPLAHIYILIILLILFSYFIHSILLLYLLYSLILFSLFSYFIPLPISLNKPHKKGQLGALGDVVVIIKNNNSGRSVATPVTLKSQARRGRSQFASLQCCRGGGTQPADIASLCLLPTR